MISPIPRSDPPRREEDTVVKSTASKDATAKASSEVEQVSQSSVKSSTRKLSTLRRAGSAQMSLQMASQVSGSTATTSSINSTTTTSSQIKAEAAQEVARASADLAAVKQALKTSNSPVYRDVLLPEATSAYQQALKTQQFVKLAATTRVLWPKAQAEIAQAVAESTKVESLISLPQTAASLVAQATQALNGASTFKTSANPADQAAYNQLLSAYNEAAAAQSAIDGATNATALSKAAAFLSKAQTDLATAIQVVNAQAAADAAAGGLQTTAANLVSQILNVLTIATYLQTSPNSGDQAVYSQLQSAYQEALSAQSLANSVTNPSSLATATNAVNQAQTDVTAAINAEQLQIQTDKSNLFTRVNSALPQAMSDLVQVSFLATSSNPGPYIQLSNAVTELNIALALITEIGDPITLQNAATAFTQATTDFVLAVEAVNTQLIFTAHAPLPLPTF